MHIIDVKPFDPSSSKKIECHHLPQIRFMLTDSNFKEPGFVGVSMIPNSSFFLTFRFSGALEGRELIARRLGAIHGRALEKKYKPMR